MYRTGVYVAVCSLSSNLCTLMPLSPIKTSLGVCQYVIDPQASFINYYCIDRLILHSVLLSCVSPWLMLSFNQKHPWMFSLPTVIGSPTGNCYQPLAVIVPNAFANSLLVWHRRIGRLSSGPWCIHCISPATLLTCCKRLFRCIRLILLLCSALSLHSWAAINHSFLWLLEQCHRTQSVIFQLLLLSLTLRLFFHHHKAK